MSTPAVLVDTDQQIAVVTLNRPKQLNAVNADLRRELTEALARVNADPRVKAVVLTGAGDRAFCAGQDLEEAMHLEWHQIADWLLRQRNMYQSVRDLDKPCVAAVNGVAAGAGFQISLCADLRIIAPGTRIGQPEVKAGLASIVGSYLMTLHLGHTHNVQMSLTGELISGQRAYDIGLVSELADEGTVLDHAVRRAHALARLPETPLRVSKRRFRAMTQPGFDEAVTAGIQAQLECYSTGEPQRVMAQFFEERRARNAPTT